MVSILARRFAAAFLILIVLLPFPASGADGISYDVKIEGINESALSKAALDASGLAEENQRPVLTMRALNRRVEESLTRIRALLRSRGYYAATQDFAVKEAGDGKAEVVIRVELGPVYRIGTFDLKVEGAGADTHVPDVPFKELGLKPGDPARAEVVAEAGAKLLAALARRAYPLARITDRRNIVDHAAKTLSVELRVAPGPYSLTGPIRIEGLTDVDARAVRRRISWEVGTPFNADRLETVRKKLRETGLFTSVIVRHADQLDARGRLPVIVEVKERKHRSIGAGASYSSTEGPLGKVFWEHRNLLGGGEHLRFRVEGGEIRQGVFGDFRIPDFGTTDQDLVFDARVARESPDGFTSREIAAVARLERRLWEHYKVSGGIGLDRSIVDDQEADGNFTFLTFPFSLRRDTTEDLLDPHQGGRDTLSLTPNFGIIGTKADFLRAELFDTVYVPVIPDKVLTLAGWARVGTIVGADFSDIPANKRLYSGGSGSVRGYALNSIGPLDADNDPVGGRSVTALGIELRWRVAGPFGVAAFWEAGGVYEDPMPEWGDDLQTGAGLGLRYYIPRIGPVRLDVAVPLNRRNSVDDAFQILVSLGQAF